MIQLGLSATIRQMLIFRIVNETCKLTAGKIACWTKSIFVCCTQSCDFVCCRQRPITNTRIFFFCIQAKLSAKFRKIPYTKKIRKKNIHVSKFPHIVYVTKKQSCRKEEKICLKTNLHLSTKRQKQQSETNRTSFGCTGRQEHCRRSALLSHPGLMPREKDSERCRCSDKEEKKCVKK